MRQRYTSKSSLLKNVDAHSPTSPLSPSTPKSYGTTTFEGYQSSAYRNYTGVSISKTHTKSLSYDESFEQPRTYHYRSDSYDEKTIQNRIGTIKKDYYQITRQQQKENWLIDIIKEMWSYIYNSFSSLQQITIKTREVAEPELVLDPEIQMILDSFRKFVSIKYDSTNEKHEFLLRHLWKVSFPKEKLEKRITPQWKKLGFQGTDPATDFRGSGVFGLWNMIYMAEMYEKQYRLMFGKCVQLPESYPFAIASFNVIMLLFDILGWGLQSRISSNHRARKAFIDLIVKYCKGAKQDDWFVLFENEEEESPTMKEGILLDFELNMSQPNIENVPKKKKRKRKKLKRKKFFFEEVYCAAFRIMDYHWYEMNARVFDFNKVLNVVKTRIEDLLETEFHSIEDVILFNKANKV